jgi:hypothetical protein
LLLAVCPRPRPPLAAAAAAAAAAGGGVTPSRQQQNEAAAAAEYEANRWPESLRHLSADDWADEAKRHGNGMNVEDFKKLVIEQHQMEQQQRQRDQQ